MKNKKLKNLLWVIALLPILVIFMKIILPSIKKEREVKAYQDSLKESSNPTQTSNQLTRQIASGYTDQNNECYIEIKNIVDIETHGEEVDVYPVNRNGQLWKTPFKYNGKGDFSLTASNGDEVYPGTWKFVSKHPGVSIKAYQQVN
jgi:hypothetical protein